MSEDYVLHGVLAAPRSAADQVLFHLRSSAPSAFPKEKNYRTVGENILSSAALGAELLALLVPRQHRPYFSERLCAPSGA